MNNFKVGDVVIYCGSTVRFFNKKALITEITKSFNTNEIISVMWFDVKNTEFTKLWYSSYFKLFDDNFICKKNKLKH